MGPLLFSAAGRDHDEGTGCRASANLLVRQICKANACRIAHLSSLHLATDGPSGRRRSARRVRGRTRGRVTQPDPAEAKCRSDHAIPQRPEVLDDAQLDPEVGVLLHDISDQGSLDRSDGAPRDVIARLYIRDLERVRRQLIQKNAGVAKPLPPRPLDRVDTLRAAQQRAVLCLGPRTAPEGGPRTVAWKEVRRQMFVVDRPDQMLVPVARWSAVRLE